LKKNIKQIIYNKIALTENKTFILYYYMAIESLHRGFKMLNTLHDSYQQLAPTESLDKQHLQTAESSGSNYL
jgi:hypothetical protein